jgi:hypothetical protein
MGRFWTTGEDGEDAESFLIEFSRITSHIETFLQLAVYLHHVHPSGPLATN